MSVVLRTIEAFPRGRSSEQLAALLGASFDHTKKIALLAELDTLSKAGKVVKGRDGKWRPTRRYSLQNGSTGTVRTETRGSQATNALVAAPARFNRVTVSEDDAQEVDEAAERPSPQALLRYWRSALRADPRGATTGREDLHGVDWQLISGKGPVSPQAGEQLKLSIPLEALQPEFRKALLRREGEENALALGWPIAVGRRAGIPVAWPVGLLSAAWQRGSEHLQITIDADDVLINPDWITGAARTTGWRRNELAEIFTADADVGLHSDEFLARLREAAAGQFCGRVTGETLSSRLELESVGIHDIAGLFLPNESSFTAGASRDLETISGWHTERLARSALAPVLGLEADNEPSDFPVLNLGPLNGEQLAAVRDACSAPLSVVTGPPGTGKSQAIVSMAASVLAGGGTVLIASKNHQALDAVEDRLGSIASTLPFLVRTLDPNREIDRSFESVLAELVSGDSLTGGLPPDETLRVQLTELAIRRSGALKALIEGAQIECQIAEILERLEARERAGVGQTSLAASQPPRSKAGLGLKITAFLRRLVRKKAHTGSQLIHDEPFNVAGANNAQLLERLSKLRARRASITNTEDPIELSIEIEKLAKAQLPAIMQERVRVDEEKRRALAAVKDDREFEGKKGPIPGDIARQVLAHRPLWLASVLGTPKRVPLDDGLFDLVIFDEASQCDIASAIPLFARAKRAVVVGDDQQLAFIPQIGLAQDRNLMQAQGLPIRGMGRFAQSRRSLFDFALRVPNVPRVTLRHQYRSAGAIVEYISGNFYGGELVVSQPLDAAPIPRAQKPGLAWTDVKAPSVPASGNINRPEIDAIVCELVKLLETERYTGSIGVISPFRAQVLAIEEAARARVSTDLLEKCAFRVATVDGFQGQERDLILFSPCIGPSSPASGLTFVQRDPRRLNVAISRARAVAHVFGDLQFARSGKVRALATLAAYATEPRHKSGEGVFDSEWERRVYHALKERGLDPKPQHEIAGRRLDFALFGTGGIKLDLEVDGRRWHQTADGRRKSADLWRDEQMKALGWRVRRFWVDELSQNMEACLDLVEQDLS